MFDVGFFEILLLLILGLVVVGHDKLPGVLRTGALWIGRIKQQINEAKYHIEKEIGADEIRQQLHNEAIMKGLKDTQYDITETLQRASQSVSTTSNSSASVENEATVKEKAVSNPHE